MRALDFPQWLFEKFVPIVGHGEVYKGLAKADSLGGGTWNLIHINPVKYPNEHGYTGAMGWQGKRFDVSRFAIWSIIPEGDLDSVGEPEAIFFIKAVVKNEREKITVHFPFSYGLDLESRLIPLVADVLKVANETLRANLVGAERS